MVLKHFRARYSKGVLEPLEAIDLEEGAEVSVSIEEAPSAKRDLEAFRRAAGGWKGNSDPDETEADDLRIPHQRLPGAAGLVATGRAPGRRSWC